MRCKALCHLARPFFPPPQKMCHVTAALRVVQQLAAMIFMATPCAALQPNVCLSVDMKTARLFLLLALLSLVVLVSYLSIVYAEFQPVEIVLVWQPAIGVNYTSLKQVKSGTLGEYTPLPYLVGRRPFLAYTSTTASSNNSKEDQSLSSATNILTTATHSPSIQLSTHSPSLQSTTHSPSPQSTTHSPSFQSTTHPSSLQSATHSPSLQSTTHSPSLQSTTHSPSFQSTTHPSSLQSATHRSLHDNLTTVHQDMCRLPNCVDALSLSEASTLKNCEKKSVSYLGHQLPPAKCKFMRVENYRAPVALNSQEGSGNTWLRGLLEKATGICTGFYACDVEMRAKGFLGEGIMSGNVLVVKTHVHIPQWIDVRSTHKFKYENPYGSAIYLIRNPAHAVIAEWSRTVTVDAKVRILPILISRCCMQ